MHVDTERGFSGGEVQVLLLMEGLRERGLRQVLVVPPGSDSARIARERGFEVCEIALKSQVDLCGVLQLRRLLRTAGLAHLHTGRAAWLGSVAARLAGCPVVITRRMDRRVKRDPRTWFAYRRTAREVVAISPSVRRLLEAAGVPSDRITVIPDALDPARLVAPVGRAATREALGLAENTFVVLALAQLMHRKGIDVLLRAVARLDDPRIVCTIAGDGPERESLQQLAVQLGLGDRARFLGRRGDAGDLLAACDVFCLPSRAEGMGVAALEALGAGRAVVASRVGGLGELIEHERCGLLVEPDDPAALAAALQRLHADAPLRERLAQAGPLRVDQGYRPDQYVDRHIDLYNRATNP